MMNTNCIFPSLLILFSFVCVAQCCYSRVAMEKKPKNDNLCPFHPAPMQFTKDEIANTIEPLLDEVSNYLASQVDENTRPAISANIVYKNKILWEGNYGKMSKTNDTKPTGNTIYRIASISKIFPTLFLYKLWEQGLLDLNDPIIKYAPNFAVANPFGFDGQLTLHDLASQVSGLQSLFPFDLLKADYFAWNGTLEQSLQRIRDEQILLIEPRTTCYYSNMAYAVLARVLARNFTIDGNFENWAQENIANVLNLVNTGFVLTDEIRANLATGYYATGVEAPLVDTNWFRPAGNYFSSTRDLAALSMSLMGTSCHQILNRETLIQMLAPVQKCGNGYLSEYTGSPWEINEQQSYLVIRKDGDIDGYSSSLAMIPDLELSITILMSGARPASRAVTRTVIDMIVPVFLDVLRKKNQTLISTPDPSKYVGYYQIDNIQYWNVTVSENNILTMTDPFALTAYQTLGLSYESNGNLRMKFLGGGFPCMLGQSNLDVQNGALLRFSNLTDGKYNQFDIPGLNLFMFKRQN